MSLQPDDVREVGQVLAELRSGLSAAWQARLSLEQRRSPELIQVEYELCRLLDQADQAIGQWARSRQELTADDLAKVLCVSPCGRKRAG